MIEVFPQIEQILKSKMSVKFNFDLIRLEKHKRRNALFIIEAGTTVQLK